MLRAAAARGLQAPRRNRHRCARAQGLGRAVCLDRDRVARVQRNRGLLRADGHVEAAPLVGQPAERQSAGRPLVRQGRVEVDTVRTPAEPAPAVQEGLQEPALAGQERERALAAAHLGELIERRLHERLDAALREVVGRAAGDAERERVDRVDRVGHRGPVGVGALLVVVEVVEPDRLRLAPLPGVGQHDHVGLLDEVAGVALELRPDLAARVQQHRQSVGDRLPRRVGLLAEQRGCLCGQTHRRDRSDVGVDLVVDVEVMLIGALDAGDGVAPVARRGRPAGPEVRGSLEHRPALALASSCPPSRGSTATGRRRRPT